MKSLMISADRQCVWQSPSHGLSRYKEKKEDQRAQLANVTGEWEDLQGRLKDWVFMAFH